MTGSVHLVKGADPILRADAVDALVEDLLAGDDRTLALEDHTLVGRATPSGGDGSGAGRDAPDAEVGDGASVDQPVFRQIMTALASPPFMTTRRVVVVREIGHLTTEQIDELIRYLEDPFESTALVLVTGGGRTNPRLAKALKAAGAGEVVPDAEQGSPGRRGEPTVVARELDRATARAAIALTDAARDRIAAHLGGDAGRVTEIVGLLRTVHGEGATLEVADVEPYLGEAGTVERYALANAIDAGDAPEALAVLHRMLHATSARETRALHPLQVLATLQFHYRDLLRLDDPTVTTKERAAAVLGTKSPYAARYRLDAARALGGDGLREAVALLARADLDLRGATGMPAEAVVEILVARLAHLAGRRRRARPRR